jgi:hypothetical protein
MYLVIMIHNGKHRVYSQLNNIMNKYSRTDQIIDGELDNQVMMHLNKGNTVD